MRFEKLFWGFCMLPYNWKEYLRPDNIREAINRNSSIISILAAVIAIIAIAFVVRELIPHKPSFNMNVYFYDLATHKLVVRSASDTPPLTGATGKPTLVKAFLYACGSCDNKYIAYLMKYTKQAQAAVKAMQSGQTPAAGPNINPMQEEFILAQGMLVRSPDAGSKWVSANSAQGRQLMEPKPCPSGNVRACLPK